MENQNTPTSESPSTSCGLATASLVCGICGVIFGPLAGIPAIVTGHMALGRIKKSGEVLQGRGKARAGLILGYIFTVLVPILAIAGFAAGNAAIAKAKSVNTNVIARTFESAVDGFVAEYGKMPVEGSSDVTLVCDNGVGLLDTLLGSDEKLNPKSIRFMTGKETRNKRYGLMFNGTKATGFYDAWGNPYNIRLDLDNDGKIEVNGRILNGRRAAVWTDGADEKPGTEDDVKTW